MFLSAIAIVVLLQFLQAAEGFLQTGAPARFGRIIAPHHHEKRILKMTDDNIVRFGITSVGVIVPSMFFYFVVKLQTSAIDTKFVGVTMEASSASKQQKREFNAAVEVLNEKVTTTVTESDEKIADATKRIGDVFVDLGSFNSKIQQRDSSARKLLSKLVSLFK
jgi:hypothetical protein